MSYTGYSFQILIKFEYSDRVSKKYLNMKFHENPPTGSRVVPCGSTKTCTDITKPIVAFQNFENALKKGNCAACVKKAESIFDAKICETCFLALGVVPASCVYRTGVSKENGINP
jgi:hypothetical protein